MTKKICVIGGGRWGQNHIRTLDQLGNLGGIVETEPKRLKELLTDFPVRGFSKVDAALEKGFDGYVVASPAETHYPIGKKLLEKGCSVLIEKPMTLSSIHSRELIEIAKQKGARLMVGHLLLFHPAIRKIKEIIESGKIGRLFYIYSNRMNLGTVRTEENVFWSFAPHDIAVINYLVGEKAHSIEAKGARFIQDQIYDVTMAQFAYPGNVHAHIYVSWLHPFKEQRLVVVGSRAMIAFDDSSKEKNIFYYDKYIDWVDQKPVKCEKPDEIIDYERKLPLTAELEYFVANLDHNYTVANGETGHEVIEILEKVQQIISSDCKGGSA